MHKRNIACGFQALRSCKPIWIRLEFVTIPRVKEYRFQAFDRFLNRGAWSNEQLFLDDPLAVRKIHSKYLEFFRGWIGQRNCYGIGVYDFAYVRCNCAQDLAQVEARRDSGRQIEEQLKPLVLTLKFRFSAHGCSIQARD